MLCNSSEVANLFTVLLPKTTARTPRATQRVVSRLAKDVEDEVEEEEQRADGFSSAEVTSLEEDLSGILTRNLHLFSNACIRLYLVIYIAPTRNKNLSRGKVLQGSYSDVRPAQTLDTYGR